MMRIQESNYNRRCKIKHAVGMSQVKRKPEPDTSGAHRSDGVISRPTGDERRAAGEFFEALDKLMASMSAKEISIADISKILRIDVDTKGTPTIDRHLAIGGLQEIVIGSGRPGGGKFHGGVCREQVRAALARLRKVDRLYKGPWA